MRKLFLSATHKLPSESNSRLRRSKNFVAVVPLDFDVKSVCPSTTVAAPPILRLVVSNFKTR